MRGRVTYISKMLLVLILPIIAGFGCSDKVVEPPQPHVSSIQLTATDLGVTDLWLYVKLNIPPSGPRAFVLKRDGQTILTINSSPIDTFILDKQLLPKHTYKYQAYRLNDSTIIDSSDALTITTIDTTSHNFTWEMVTLGVGLADGFRDVAIINDTCIWAVGEIYVRDSLGNLINPPYNVAKWDGKKWELKNIAYVPVRAVYAFSENDIWAGTSGPYYWNGTRWRTFNISGAFNGYINKFWGTSSNNLYMVGTNGAIAHYDGTSWQKLESGTDLDINDISGVINPKTGEEEILAVASQPLFNRERKILQITGTTVTTIPDSGIRTSLTGVWFNPGSRYYLVGDGVFRKQLYETIWIKDKGSEESWYYKQAIRGNSFNDITIACHSGDILHFNGYDWKSYLRYTHLGYGNYASVAMKGNLVVAVGSDYGKGVIAMGRRQ